MLSVEGHARFGSHFRVSGYTFDLAIFIVCHFLGMVIFYGVAFGNEVSLFLPTSGVVLGQHHKLIPGISSKLYF